MDKYDEAIEWLVEHADERIRGESVIYRAWDDPYADGHCLFLCATPTGHYAFRGDLNDCGCLTQIRGSLLEIYHAWTPELTAAIRADERIPVCIEEISNLRGEELRAALQPFAEWQRKLDREIRGVEAASV